MSAVLRILCVDDNDRFAEALGVRLGHEPDFRWLGWVSDGETAAARIAGSRPDVVLMDLDMPGTNTFGLMERVAVEFPDVRVIVLSGHVNQADINRALDCGAWGYLSKNEDVDEIIAGIRGVGRGEIALSKEVEAVQRRTSR